MEADPEVVLLLVVVRRKRTSEIKVKSLYANNKNTALTILDILVIFLWGMGANRIKKMDDFILIPRQCRRRRLNL
jgi:hypothetical protein